jgi:hypothetical protein
LEQLLGSSKTKQNTCKPPSEWVVVVHKQSAVRLLLAAILPSNTKLLHTVQ